jgi:divalent metal cation (Fe/Co/Zn/Cd) transporter
VRNPVNTIEDMKKLLLGYRDNMRVEIESGIAVTAKTVADLRALATWPDGLVLDIHVDLDPRLSVVRVERHPDPTKAIPYRALP